ncbi:MAG: hypothetical protein AAGB31_10845 [Bdellovibrio sp.]
MKKVIISTINHKEYQGSKSLALLGMIYDDLTQLLRFIHKAQREGFLTEPFYFNNQIEYLDIFWHHFILHTRLYHNFCQTELGEYLHHEPIQLRPNGNEQQKDKNIYIEQLGLLERNMGEDFVQRIFFLYPELLK